MASNGVRLLVATALTCLLVAAPSAYATITSCGQVGSSLSPCISYIWSAGRRSPPPPPPACCNGVRGLNAAARTTSDRKTACGCVKKLLINVPGLNLGVVAGLPSKCRVKTPFPISPSTDCSKIH